MKTDSNDNLKETMRKLCGTVTGVQVRPLDPNTDMPALAARFADRPGTILLLSGSDLDCARYHILGVLPWLTLRAAPGKVQLETRTQQRELKADPFEALRACLNCCALPAGQWEPPLAAGLMGYLSYDLKDCLESLPRSSIDDLGLPHMLFVAPSVLVVQDKQQQTTRLLVPERNGSRHDIDAALAQFDTLTAGRMEQKEDPAYAGELRANMDRPGYQQAVQQVIDYIAAGDVYQVNLSQRFETSFDGSGFELFRRLYANNPAPFFAYVQAGDHEILSTSPERFLMRDGCRVETRPIKGTRPRMENPEQDAAMRRTLSTSAKDDAELSMIVDLLRNDIGKVCQAGSVRVAEHKRLEAYANVYHLVSIVEGELDADMDAVDLIKAAFPGGSITGCPKVRAMEIIDELESCRRHIYCGSIGYISFHDTLDLSIAIRTATLVNNTLRYSVGGGIVYDSDPKSEYEETLHKGRTLMAACRSARQASPAPVPTVWFNGRLMPATAAALPVSDLGVQYGYGFFETLRADNGAVPLLDRHLARFEKTWKALMPMAPPDVTWKTVIEQVLAANNLHGDCAALKILATRGSRTVPPWDTVLLVIARPYRHRLAQTDRPGLRLATYPHPRQTPLAAHKTLNYLYYHQAGRWARQQTRDEALILNPDGSVSETNTANLLLVRGRKIVRPQSTAVLPGVMSETVCRQLAAWDYAVSEQRVQPEDLLNADQVLAANALMGAVPVISLDHKERPAGGNLWQRLNDAIIPGWRQ